MALALGVVIPKLLKISNYQTRSIAFETSIRNSALTMTIAILIQDRIGDFYSSMFIVAGIYGLEMYIAGIILLRVFKKVILPEEGSTGRV